MGFSAFKRSLFELVDVWTAEVSVSADCHSTSAVSHTLPSLSLPLSLLVCLSCSSVGRSVRLCVGVSVLLCFCMSVLRWLSLSLCCAPNSIPCLCGLMADATPAAPSRSPRTLPSCRWSSTASSSYRRTVWPGWRSSRTRPPASRCSRRMAGRTTPSFAGRRRVDGRPLRWRRRWGG